MRHGKMFFRYLIFSTFEVLGKNNCMLNSVFKKALLLLSFVCSLNIVGQNDKLESLKALIFEADSLSKNKHYDLAEKKYHEALNSSFNIKKDDSTALVYRKLGVLEWKRKDYSKSENFYKKGLRYDSISSLGADLYYNISLTKRKNGEVDSTLFYLDKAIKIYKGLEDSPKAFNVFLSAGLIYRNLQQHKKALEYALIAHNGFQKTDNLKKLASTSDLIALIQDDLGNTERAFYYYFHSLRLKKKLKDTLGICNSYNNIAIAHKTEKNHDSAIYYYKKVLSLENSGTIFNAKTLHNLGVSYHKLGNRFSAKKTYNEALNIELHLKDTLSAIYTLNELVLLNTELNDLENANKQLRFSNTLIKKTQAPPEVVYRNHYVKSCYYSKIGDYKAAYRHQKEYSELYQSIFSNKQIEVIQELQEKYESEKKRNENLKLSLENKENHILINKQGNEIRKNHIFLICLGLLALLLMVAYLLLKQKQKSLKQQQKYERLQAIYEGQETIKSSISKDLHDIIASNISGIGLKIKALSLSKDRQQLETEISNGITEINKQIRLISHRLSPLDDKIKEHKLSEIIISRLSEFQLYNDIFINLKTEIPTVLDNLPIEKQSNFYGILLEILNNIVKHAKATSVIITMKVDKLNKFHLKIKDNGIGFDVSNATGIGIINIKQRTQLLKGSCVFNKLDDGGTEFYLEFLFR
ncbi:tetratricopeptide repeat-containing sensor histidine kinase [Flavivirga sp. 57AJ16]|uniref:tetratricopeptide repeat-containing sensor histidine kinase n=1 Tax=Flavivirga sp. 57AJ16 TaxID=3025307 RepID=UPI0023651F2F|nr:tetratricopeptide repeat-containing sensor histidine kinase [Flavivirga sp. 57AJ16]MDD7887117.1 tetratricopeptide repeat protein [Flavivirga sp. 57AJ16]